LESPGNAEKKILSLIKRGPIFAALLDPENFTSAKAAEVAAKAERAGVSIILVGGSTLSDQRKLDLVVKSVKSHVACHVILFPGNVTGVSKFADAILFSSLLNSTNPYFIVGAQALGSIEVYKSGLESIPMGYLVFGNSSSTSFIGQVNPLPISKPDLAVIYSLAAKYLGMRTLYLEAGSGAAEPVMATTIKAVRKYYDGILIVGGGITTPAAAARATEAGADIVVVGNLLQSRGFEPTLKAMIKAARPGQNAT
jgi:phosphoglycerol geranylgeranyltransferase